MSLPLCKDLDDVRRRIDEVDEKIVALLVQRRQYIDLASRFKKGSDPTALARVKETLSRVRAYAKAAGADPRAIEAVYRAIIETLIKEEMKAAPKAGA